HAKCDVRLSRLLDRAAVILVSHQVHSIKRLCDRALLLERARRIGYGSPSELLERYVDCHTTTEHTMPLEILAEEISNVSGTEFSETLQYGSHLFLRIRVTVLKNTRCEYAQLNIVDRAGFVHAQANVQDLLTEFQRGENELLINVGPLFLSRGRFNCNL